LRDNMGSKKIQPPTSKKNEAVFLFFCFFLIGISTSKFLSSVRSSDFFFFSTLPQRGSFLAAASLNKHMVAM